MAISICIPTFRRPELLRQLLDSLTHVEADGARLTVVVVDNDPAGTAGATVDEFRDRFPGLIYVVEPEPGIPAARNRLVRVALEHESDYLVFLDDDEWVESADWLGHLLATARAFSADAVLGPVLSSYEEGTPEWVRAGGFFERPRFATGADVPHARTGNSMIACTLFDRGAETFPPSLHVGEDTYFFERARRNGASIIWCDEAVVHEHIPLTKVTTSWLFHRAVEQGVTFTLALRLIGESRGRRMLLGLKYVARILLAVVLVVPSALLGRATMMRVVLRSLIAAGGLWGLVRRSGARRGDGDT